MCGGGRGQAGESKRRCSSTAPCSGPKKIPAPAGPARPAMADAGSRRRQGPAPRPGGTTGHWIPVHAPLNRGDPQTCRPARTLWTLMAQSVPRRGIGHSWETSGLYAEGVTGRRDPTGDGREKGGSCRAAVLPGVQIACPGPALDQPWTQPGVTALTLSGLEGRARKHEGHCPLLTCLLPHHPRWRATSTATTSF